MGRDRGGGFYGRWVAANAAAEMVGLGASLLMWGAVGPWIEARAGVVAGAVVTVLTSTAFEGTAVGLAQWSVLRRERPDLRRGAWLGATAAGAGIAWTLGMVPSTMMQAAAEASPAAQGPDIPDVLVYALAALMGLLLGVVLAWAQWLVLRRHVPRAWLWLPANSLAWAAGMPIVFLAVSLAWGNSSLLGVIATMLIGLFAAGAAVGAVHGLFLTRMLKPPPVAAV